MEDTRKAWPTESPKQGSQRLTETEATVTEPCGSELGALHIRYVVELGVLLGRLRLFAFPWGPFPPTGLPHPTLI